MKINPIIESEKIYLEKKGFDELLNNIESLDFGNSSNSELARNMQETFFK